MVLLLVDLMWFLQSARSAHLKIYMAVAEPWGMDLKRKLINRTLDTTLDTSHHFGTYLSHLHFYFNIETSLAL